MHASPLLVVLLLAGCHGGSRSSDTPRTNGMTAFDSATARRICQAPDSVIAGTKDCVLLDQARPADRIRPPVPRP